MLKASFYLYVYTSLSSLHHKLLHYCCDLCNSSSSEHGTVEPHCPGDRQFTSGNVVVVVNVVNVSGSLEIHSCAPPWRKEKRGAKKKGLIMRRYCAPMSHLCFMPGFVSSSSLLSEKTSASCTWGSNPSLYFLVLNTWFEKFNKKWFFLL